MKRYYSIFISAVCLIGTLEGMALIDEQPLIETVYDVIRTTNGSFKIARKRLLKLSHLAALAPLQGQTFDNVATIQLQHIDKDTAQQACFLDCERAIQQDSLSLLQLVGAAAYVGNAPLLRNIKTLLSARGEDYEKIKGWETSGKIQATFEERAQVDFVDYAYQSLRSLCYDQFAGCTKATLVRILDPSVTNMQSGCFEDLVCAKEISINDTELVEVPGGIFQSCRSVEKLDLHDNPKLTQLTMCSLSGLHNLKTLIISHDLRLEESLEADLQVRHVAVCRR